MSMQLKILDQRHKQKLNLKALDAVLFGPPLRKYALNGTWMFNQYLQCKLLLHKSAHLLPLQVHNIIG